jgi:hypothetical protein
VTYTIQVTVEVSADSVSEAKNFIRLSLMSTDTVIVHMNSEVLPKIVSRNFVDIHSKMC